MLRLVQKFSALYLRRPSHIGQRTVVSDVTLEKLGLPKKPKPPKPVFSNFRDIVKKDLIKQTPNIGVIEITKIAAARWRELTPKQKNEWLMRSKKEREEYKAELTEYFSSLTPQQRKDINDMEENTKLLQEERLRKLVLSRKVKDLKKPKRPLTSYMRFVKENEKKENENAKEFIKRIAKLWDLLPEYKKMEYQKSYKEDYRTYLNDLTVWEEKMIQLGNADVVRSKTLKEKLKEFAQ